MHGGRERWQSHRGDGRRKTRNGDALGSAFETPAKLEVAEAAVYLRELDPELRDRLEHIIAALTRLTA